MTYPDDISWAAGTRSITTFPAITDHGKFVELLKTLELWGEGMHGALAPALSTAMTRFPQHEDTFQIVIIITGLEPSDVTSKESAAMPSISNKSWQDLLRALRKRRADISVLSPLRSPALMSVLEENTRPADDLFTSLAKPLLPAVCSDLVYVPTFKLRTRHTQAINISMKRHSGQPPIVIRATAVIPGDHVLPTNMYVFHEDTRPMDQRVAPWQSMPQGTVFQVNAHIKGGQAPELLKQWNALQFPCIYAKPYFLEVFRSNPAQGQVMFIAYSMEHNRFLLTTLQEQKKV
ncbi:hypothetical protein PTSG_07863 [Salpingoeca rosetta]|uniref:Mediator of RNA polymerase II transcription subunit 25 von Willebrand factor type A domain-containing protein n=1 Tax=Salpingoeca rosetta (strain ATCC 50818 / BSB-021) TaxID=946362 RepID=F2UGJ6_SALR5|nr:uncharacterized protein PTSG_07863 [Salpingoeca rosetta]EGD75746.1 hypothetical protein PTSG_07863 [Salpingoeca rosetta]|eukprot:XP_004991667.1 hypothetical protein PTSG_07863 [Salpingoeca rosetta]